VSGVDKILQRRREESESGMTNKGMKNTEADDDDKEKKMNLEMTTRQVTRKWKDQEEE